MAGPGAYVFGDEERREVEDVLRGGHLSRYGSGDDPGFTQKVHTLEREFAAHCGVAHEESALLTIQGCVSCGAKSQVDSR
ncbi:hypothetical protein ACFOY4_01020 [Actinomadura syzygii]|uniref:Uncharacterized protein n=1 Tax=Actinomadura syzygii TaxID=1427538 RepID=A0A5D0TTL5_9ACTN|nr:hypothetical protein [Actinomadura syzygii]TYC08662.1 hypothetical protein FXF65_37890 [Actinomadura syzygii]